MTSFNDLLKTQDESRIGSMCITGLWRATLTDEDRAQFDAALKSRSVKLVTIHRTMKAMGFEGTDSSVQRHRAGGCRCLPTN